MSDSVMSLMLVMFLSMAKRIYLMSSGHQHLLVNTSSIIISENGTLNFPSPEGTRSKFLALLL